MTLRRLVVNRLALVLGSFALVGGCGGPSTEVDTAEIVRPDSTTTKPSTDPAANPPVSKAGGVPLKN